MKKDAATADRWQQVAQIYLAAVERDPADRAVFLREACGGDEGLRREVDSLLDYEGGADRWIEQPAAALAAPMLENCVPSSVLSGRQIGPYVIGPLLDAGGMGEVYRARDTKLGREVAIKILPPEFTADADRRARFAREARLLAALNHPHIAQIYGLEELDASSGSGQPAGQALVMELVPGKTLADIISGQGHALKIEDALAIARQIADALAAAHAKGIVHRDLKPANIKVTSDGMVKVLDFGLAKVADREAADLGPQLSGESKMSADGTRHGVILGTAAYMSPEQARGQLVDKRTDVWAFGCVLFEILTGQRAFPGDTLSDTIARILEREPDWKALPDATPVSLRRLLQRCLRKDPQQRLHDIADARIEIDEVLGSAAPLDDVMVPPVKRRSWRLLWSAGLVIAGVGFGFLASRIPGRPDVAAPRPVLFVETLAAGRVIPPGTLGTGTTIALSPDGRTLVYTAQEQGEWHLYSRSFDQLNQRAATPIGDVNARDPFFSPDGQWIGFRVNRSLRRVPVRGGPAQTIVDLPGPMSTQGGASWNADGTILVGGGLKGLLRVSEQGGEVETLVAAAEGRGIWYPQLLPGGRAVLYTESETIPDAGELMVVDLATRVPRRIHRGTAGRYLSTGHLVYVAKSTIFGVAFDLDRLAVRGTPVDITTGVRVHSEGGAVQLALAEAGAAAYVPAVSVQRTLVWVDRNGKESSVGAEPRAYSNPRVSPNGSQIAVTMRDGGLDVHVWDVARGTLRQLTFDPIPNFQAVWLDNQRLAFWAGTLLRPQVSVLTADGSTAPRPLTRDPNVSMFPIAASSDGSQLLAMEYTGRGRDIAAIPLQEPAARKTLVTGGDNPVLSPNGQWLAYESNKTGRREIYVRPFPELGEGDIPVTTEGGRCPVWARDGSELYYWKDGSGIASIWGVRIAPGPPANWAPQRRIIDGPYVSVSTDTSYDVWGGRFLLMKELAPPKQEIVVALHWFEELKRRVPIK